MGVARSGLWAPMRWGGGSGLEGSRGGGGGDGGRRGLLRWMVISLEIRSLHTQSISGGANF